MQEWLTRWLENHAKDAIFPAIFLVLCCLAVAMYFLLLMLSTSKRRAWKKEKEKGAKPRFPRKHPKDCSNAELSHDDVLTRMWVESEQGRDDK